MDADDSLLLSCTGLIVRQAFQPNLSGELKICKLKNILNVAGGRGD